MSKKQHKEIFQHPKGMNDILPEVGAAWDRVRDVTRGVAEFYNFSRIDTPVLEDENLFKKSVGEGTDIVEHQMFSLKTSGGDALVLRPEGTAPVMRAYIQHGLFSLGSPARLYYIAPMFRHENPQKWRYRQFHQAGFEIIGDPGAIYDAQAIMLIMTIFSELKVKDPLVHINSIGCRSCRVVYRNRLKAFYKDKLAKVCKDCRARYAANPMRLLDCKIEKDVEIKAGAPMIIDDLCSPCHNHFRSVLEFLDALRIPYHLDPLLVRGLDYYNRTVFEVMPPKSGGADEPSLAQSALASGGRFDYLAEMLGGRQAPAVGGAIGLERLVEYLAETGALKAERPRPRVYIVQLGDFAKKKSLLLLEEFRRAGVKVAESLGRDSMKAQLRVADRMGVEMALIIGQKEAHEDVVILRDMRSGGQETVTMEKVIQVVKKKLGK